MTRKEYVDFLFPNIEHDKEYYEAKYPKRDLKEGSMVVRVAPSPTGFVHFGTLFQAVNNRRLASSTDGLFYLRIEDTDQKREVENGAAQIIDALNYYEIEYDEGPTTLNEDKGAYGPYIQSKRKDIYGAFAKYMIEHDLAYPSFTKESELEEIRKNQEIQKERIGYYGKYAIDRNLSMEEVVEKVKNGESFVVRLKSIGDFNNKRIFKDLIKGDIEMPENDIDYVLLKSDGLPTYHFAHVVDDYLMHTTHITRGEEWLSSMPVNVQTFEMLGLPVPNFCHTAAIMKEENGKRRKISKRKDPEANVEEFKRVGFPKEAVKEYLMTVANSNYEEWKEQNPNLTMDDFPISFAKMNVCGALFDMEKLVNISKNIIAELSAEDLYNRILDWSKTYDSEFSILLEKYKEKSIAILNIERGGEKPRKDYARYSDVRPNIWYMYDELYEVENYEFGKITNPKDISDILTTYINNYYDENDTQDVWFQKMKDMCDVLGYASNMKDYKKNPENYKGNVADVSTVIRVAITSKDKTPNLYDILKILGKEKIKERFANFIKE